MATLGKRVDDLEAAIPRIEDKVDALTQAVEKADWNGRGPVIKSLAEVAPYLIELASVHKSDVEYAKAERLVAERKAARRQKILAKLGITTGHRALAAVLTAIGVIGTALWGLTYLLQAWSAIHSTK